MRVVVSSILSLLIAMRAMWIVFVTMSTMGDPMKRPAENDSVVVTLRRMESLRSHLPREGRVGYITDLPEGSVAAIQAAHLARFALVPLLVDPHSDHPLAIADFSDDVAVDDLLVAGKYDLVRKVDSGLAIVKRVPP